MGNGTATIVTDATAVSIQFTKYNEMTTAHLDGPLYIIKVSVRTAGRARTFFNIDNQHGAAFFPAPGFAISAPPRRVDVPMPTIVATSGELFAVMDKDALFSFDFAHVVKIVQQKSRDGNKPFQRVTFKFATDPLLTVLTVFRPEQWLPAAATTFSATLIMQNVYGGMKSVKATDQSMITPLSHCAYVAPQQLQQYSPAVMKRAREFEDEDLEEKGSRGKSL